MSQKVQYSFLLDEKVTTIQMDEIYSEDFGTSIWPSSIHLAELIFQNHQYFRGKTVLELGCGPGLSGIAAAKCGSIVYLTDLDDPKTILQNCKKNCEINNVQNVTFVVCSKSFVFYIIYV